MAVANRDASEQELYEIAREAYLYGYPLIVMDLTMRQATNVPNATSIPLRAPINQFAHFRTYPTADARDVVRFNFDTLYSFAWLDLTPEPIVLSVPDIPDRYYLVPMLDMWTDVFTNVGTRTTGTAAGNYAITAPGWNGPLPEGVDKIVAPTAVVWVMGRTQTNGPADYDNVHKVQDGYRLTPLSQWGTAYTPPEGVDTDAEVDDTTPPLRQVNALTGVAALTRLADLLTTHPPHPNDYPVLFRMRRIGLCAGQPFDAAKLDPAIVRIINSAAEDALQDIQQLLHTGFGTRANGWVYTTDGIGTYATAYRHRAMIALGGLGANLPEDAIYPVAYTDGDGQPLTGAARYVLHFDKADLPPADAFWSITLYDNEGFQVPNALDRFALGDRDQLAFNADGSLDIHVQADPPEQAKQANWLPAPSGAFNLTMRIYSPRREVSDGSWAPPPIKKA